MIFYLNIVLTIIFFIYYSFKTTSKGMFLSPHMIIWGTPLLVLFIPALEANPNLINDDMFNLVITASLFGTMLACFVYPIPVFLFNDVHSNRSSNQSAFGRKRQFLLPIRFVNIGATIYIVYLLGSIIDRVIRSGGVISAITIGRLDDYLGGGILRGNSFELLMRLPEILYYFYLSRCLDNNRYKLVFGLASIVALFYVFTANTRLPMIMPYIAIALILFSRIPRKQLTKVMPILMAFGIITVFSFNVLGNLIRGGWIDQVGNKTIYSFKQSILIQKDADLGYYGWLNDLYTAITNGNIKLDNGAAWLYYGPLSIFPRIFWPNKPITSTSNRLSEAVYHIKIGDGNPITTFTIYGEGFWQAHYIGAFISPFLFVSMYCILIKYIQRFKYSDYWFAMLMIQMITFFRGELPTPQFILSLAFIWLFHKLVQASYQRRAI